MKAFLTKLKIATIAITILSFTGGDRATAADQPTPPLGKSCIVYFRRDALALNPTNIAVPLKTTSIGNTELGVACTLKSMRDDWIVVEQEGTELWMPKSVILFIQFAK